jgi:hypothetical protein
MNVFVLSSLHQGLHQTPQVSRGNIATPLIWMRVTVDDACALRCHGWTHVTRTFLFDDHLETCQRATRRLFTCEYLVLSWKLAPLTSYKPAIDSLEAGIGLVNPTRPFSSFPELEGSLVPISNLSRKINSLWMNMPLRLNQRSGCPRVLCLTALPPPRPCPCRTVQLFNTKDFSHNRCAIVTYCPREFPDLVGSLAYPRIGNHLKSPAISSVRSPAVYITRVTQLFPSNRDSGKAPLIIPVPTNNSYGWLALWGKGSVDC